MPLHKNNDGEMIEAPNSGSDVNQSAIETLLYVNLQIAEMRIGILSYKILSSMQISETFMNLLQLKDRFYASELCRISIKPIGVKFPF
jgi:hypothetical protein